jgi:hypothetical protein
VTRGSCRVQTALGSEGYTCRDTCSELASCVSLIPLLPWVPLAPRYSQGAKRGKWEGHRPGQARLWMGVGAIVAFAPVLGSVSSKENIGQESI